MQAPTVRRSPFYGRWWTALIVFALIRSGPFLVDKECFTTDPDAYLALAETWYRHGLFAQPGGDGIAVPEPTAYRPPLYPWLLSWFSGDKPTIYGWLTFLHIACGALTALMTWSIAKRIFAPPNELVAWLAGTAVALDPILLRQSTLIMTETAAAFGATLVWWLWVKTFVLHGRRNVLLAGLLIGLLLGFNGLLRSTGVVWLPLITGLLLVKAWNRNSSVDSRDNHIRFVPMIVALSLGWTAVTLPWVIRNYRAFGQPILCTTHGGYTLLLANNPILYEHFDQENWGRNWDEDRFHRWWESQQPPPPRDELQNDRLANRLACETIQAQPWVFLKSCVARCMWFWAFEPASGQASLPVRWMIGLWYTAVFVCFGWSGLGYLKRTSTERRIRLDVAWIPAIALIVGLMLVHAVYWSNMRMRGPIMPMVYVAAMLAFHRRDVENLQSTEAAVAKPG